MQIVRYNPKAACDQVEKIRSRALQMDPELIGRVSEIVEGVRSGGDEALIHFTKQFDGVSLTADDLRVDARQIETTALKANAKAHGAFKHAIQNIRRFHEHERQASWQIESGGTVVGQRIVAIQSAGLYVPGGRAAYPSSVAMNAVPAQVAGVPRIAVTTPPGALESNPAVAAVIHELGIDEVYRVGGAQAIAALAFGTETIPRVDKVVGPGNIYVAIAKKLVYGSVGIDSIAGPTEVVIVADESANPRFIAADLLAQAEHDQRASAICITTSNELAEEICAEVERQLELLERREIARASIDDYGAVFAVESLEIACELVNQIAPEHLELMTANDDRTASMITNAGAIFFGEWSTEPVGDYFAGPNHVLPTGGTARFSSALSVHDFLKRQSIIRYTREAIEQNADSIAAMADTEGLTAHKRAVLIRTK
jgi:histidinol dehydrogenase